MSPEAKGSTLLDDLFFFVLLEKLSRLSKCPSVSVEEHIDSPMQNFI